MLRAARLGALVAALWGVALLPGCVTPPPARPDDLCSIFAERSGWYRASKASAERWGVSEAIQLAIVHQESSFRANAKPPRTTFLWIFPGPRPTSAYGYGQVIDGTWRSYKKSTHHWGADRDDFRDVADFIGWYGDVIARRTGIRKSDARSLYLAYHEGPAGFARGSHKNKPWLVGVARKVQARASRYQRQLDGCRERLQTGPWYWPF